ncbi:MAG: hypothetical protein FD135_1190, partial [Comamonadaceae bacterium]
MLIFRLVVHFLSLSPVFSKSFTSVVADLTGQIIAVGNVTVAGTVSVNGVAQAGVRVEFSVNNSATASLCTSSTGADGSYSCNVPNSGQIKIMASQLGYVFSSITRYNLSGPEVGASIQGVIAHNVTGAVKDASGNPLSGVSINWQSQSNGSYTSGQCGVTDTTGNFSCDVPSGQVWILGNQTGFAFEQIYRANLVADESGSGFVKDASGNLLSGVYVNWFAPTTTVSGSFSSNCNTTLADGAFTCHVPQGFTGSVSAYSGTGQSFAFASLSRTNLTIDESGAVISGVALARTISGLVKDASGNVLSGVQINWSAPGTISNTGFSGFCNTTLADGAFTCHVPQGFTGYLSANQGTGQSFAFASLSRTNVTIDETGVVISGAALARTISGFVKDASGNALSGVQVNWSAPGTISNPGFSGYCNTTLADGAFTCRVPQGFTGTINAYIPASGSLSKSFTSV